MALHTERYEHLMKSIGRLGKEIPETMLGFGRLNTKAMADGIMESKSKELIALGIAIGVRCESCITYHVHNALTAGATREEVLETIGVAVFMGGASCLAYGCEALEALEEFENKDIGSKKK